MAHAILTAPQFHNEEAAFAFIEGQLWPTGPTCPKCGNADAARIGRLTGKTARVGLRKCYACRQQFTVRVGTIFEDSHLPLHLWLQAIHLLSSSKKGIASRQIQRLLNCSMKTAWFLTHRIREIMNDTDTAGPIGGNRARVEMDETYIGGREKNKHAHKRQGVGGGAGGKAAVFSLVHRNGRVRSTHVANVTAANLDEAIGKNVRAGSLIYSDDAQVYYSLKPRHRPAGRVNHTSKEYVRGDVHTNTVEGFFSILKRGITGVYHHVSQEHLHRYLNEFDFRYNEREALGVDDVERTKRAIAGAKGKRLTYETTTNPAT